MNTGHTPDSQTIANRLAIEEVLHMHARGVDRADENILKSAYWPDAEVAYGGYNGLAWTFCEALPNSIRKYSATQHTVTNILVEFNLNDAVAESYVTAYHYLESDQAEDSEMTYLGRYIDHMQKRDETWKIKFRQVVMDWNQNAPASAVLEGAPFSGLARGARGDDDPLYIMQTTVLGRN